MSNELDPPRGLTSDWNPPDRIYDCDMMDSMAGVNSSLPDGIYEAVFGNIAVGGHTFGNNPDEPESPLDKQVGGGHYKHFKIQPVEFALENNLNFAQANAVKYICRYPFKDGVKDLKKAIHMLEMLIEFEQTKESNNGN
jgi:hypothetical protein